MKTPVFLALLGIWFCTSGCRGPTYLLTADELKRFLDAGPVTPELDREALMRAIPPVGAYKLGPGDLIEVRGPRAMFIRAPEQATIAGENTHLARVDSKGTVEIPLVGEVQVKGLSLTALESFIAAELFPKYLLTKPSVVVRIVEPAKTRVSVMGAVEQPGIHELMSDQMTLFGALSAAGGILKSNNLVVGARRIRVRSADTTRDVVLPVKGLNVPFSDVPLSAGDIVEVERYEPDTFTVVGLVKKPGAYEYPPEVKYNLMQGLAVAGGVDTIADPPYATVFRKDASGQIIPATFEIHGDGLTAASLLPIKPGDVISLEQTPGTWTRSLLAQILRIQFGFFVDNRAAK